MSTGIDITLAQNIAARKAAETIADLCVDEIDRLKREYSSAAVERFFSTLVEIFPGMLAKPVQLPESMTPMSDDDSRRFGATSMPFGKFEGRRVDETDLGYLEWIDDDEWRGQLRRYLLSRRIQLEKEASDE